jgi:hypothetical protein
MENNDGISLISNNSGNVYEG